MTKNEGFYLEDATARHYDVNGKCDKYLCKECGKWYKAENCNYGGNMHFTSYNFDFCSAGFAICGRCARKPKYQKIMNLAFELFDAITEANNG